MGISLFATISIAQAAEIDLSSKKLVVGAKLQAYYFVAKAENQPSFAIGLRKKTAKDFYWTGSIQPGERGSLELPSPHDPGEYEAVIFDSNKKNHSAASFSIVVTPTPGALKADKSEYLAGEKISVFARKEDDRYYGYGWIGFFKQGRHSKGGASIADERITYQRIPAADEAAVFNAPSNPGIYEFRLYDRDNQYYILDRTAVKVVLPPTPGVMMLAKDVFMVGEPLDLKIQLESGHFYGNAWIGLFRSQRKAPGGGTIDENRLTYQRVNTETEQLTFATPSKPGVYHFRLYDRDNQYYVLDSVSFEVVVPTTPGVMSLEKEIFTIGEPLNLNVKLVPGHFYGNAWIGLFRAERKARGGALIERERLTYQRVNLETETLSFTTPSSPGQYEFMLYDRDAGYFNLDQLSFTVEVPPTPGVMSLAKESFIVGEPITLNIKLTPGRHYGNAWIGLFHKAREVAGGGGVDRSRQTYQRVNLKTEQLTYIAPSSPGIYEFRLYDRDANHYLLDTLDFKVVVPTTPDVLSLAKKQYVTGEPLNLAVKMEKGRFYGNAWIGLFKKNHLTKDGAGVSGNRLTYQRANLETTELNWTTPSTPGSYEFRLYDRDSGHYQIAAVPFVVLATANPGILSVQKSNYRAGELVRVKVRLPENRHRGSSYVELARSGAAINGGALSSEHSTRRFAVNTDTPALAFEAPAKAGPWELRYYDRDSSRYILEIKTFTVTSDPAAGLEFTPVRFTPIPGGPAVALAPSSDGSGSGSGEGLPGVPVKPNGEPVAKLDPTNNGNGSGDGKAGDGNSGNKDNGDDKPNNEQAGDEPSGSMPSLRFVAIGSGGLNDISTIAPGQPFIIEAQYAAPPKDETVTAQLSYGDGGGQAVILHRAGEDGLYQSGVIRLPVGGN